ncbi:MAG: hypothetical protein WC529_05525 [Candidatus Margulisiibacteriota bacterium]
MKKLTVPLIALLLALAVVPAALATKDIFRSKPSRFAATVLGALSKFRESQEQVVSANDETEGAAAVSAMLRALDNCQHSAALLKPYLNDPDSLIRTVAGLLSDEIAVFIRDGNQGLAMMRRYNENPGSVSEDESVTWAQAAEKRQDESYHIMGGAVASFLPQVLANTRGQKGKIAYKISVRERAMLLFQIELLFEKQLKEYAADPTHVPEMIAGIAVLQQKLRAETYEQLRKVSNPFPEANDR